MERGIPERMLAKYFAPYVLSKAGRIVFLGIYVILIAGAIYGTTQIRVHFEVEYFISEESQVGQYYDASDRYFTSPGEPSTIYIDFSDSGPVDMSSEVNQKKLQ